MPFILEAISIVRRELRPDQAVIGFCGGPFTVAGYLIEGKPSREFLNVKRLMYSAPEVWHALMEKLTDAFSRYVRGQVRAGADVIQVFDSWVGALSPADYEEFVQPYSARILASVDCPTIHFGTGTATLLEQMRDAGGDVIGLDWRIPLDRGWEAVGDDRGVQGNLDGALLLGPWERVEAGGARRARAGCRPAGSHLQPRPRRRAGNRSRACSAVSASSSTSRPRACPHEHRRRPDGVRVAGPARRRPRLLRRHPRRPADRPGAPRGPGRALPAARDRGVESAERDHRGDAGGARGGARAAGVHRHAPLAAEDRRRGRAGAGDRRRRARRASCSRLTTPSMSIGRYRAQLEEAVGDRATIRFVERWGTDPGLVALLAEKPSCFKQQVPAHVVFTAHSLPSRILDEGDPVPRRAARDGAPRGRARRRPRVDVLLPERVADRRAVARPRHHRAPERAGGDRRPRRRRLPDRLRRRSPRDPLGPGHRGRRAGGEARDHARRGPSCRTTSRRSSTFSPGSSGGRRLYRQ